MANIKTLEDIQAILDYLDTKPADTYSSLYLYNNTITDDANILTKTTKLSNGVVSKGDIIVAQNNNIVVDTKVYKLPTLLDSILDDESNLRSTTRVYTKSLLGYIDVDKLIVNVARSFGAIFADDFKDSNKGVWEELRKLVIDFYDTNEDLDENKTPYALKKYTEGQNEYYKTYVPIRLIADIGRYLLNNGFFDVDDDNRDVIFQLKVPYTYDLMGKSTFINELYKEFNNYSDVYKNGFKQGLTRLLNTYDDIDFNKLLTTYTYHGGVGTDNSGLLNIIEVDNNDVIIDTDYTSLVPVPVSGLGKFSNGYITFKNDYTYKLYKVNYVYNTSEDTYNFTFNKSVIEKEANTFMPLYPEEYDITVKSGAININIADNKKVSRYNSYQLGLIPHDEFIDIKTMSNTDFLYSINFGKNVAEDIINNFDLDLSDKIAIYFCNNNIVRERHYATEGILYVLPNSVKVKTPTRTIQDTVNGMRNLFSNDTALPIVAYNGKSVRNTSFGVYLGESTNFEIDFNNNVDVKTYFLKDGVFGSGIIPDTNYIYINSETDTTIPKRIYYYGNTNAGIVTEKRHIDGFSLEEGATYPLGLSDYRDLDKIYPNWYKTYMRNSAPYFFDDVIQGVAFTTFLPIAIDDISSQSEAQDGEITEANIDVIIKELEEIEENISDVDIETDDVDNGNEGNTPNLPDIGTLPTPLAANLVKQYLVDPHTLNLFANSLLNPNTWDVLNFTVANPMMGIVSIQANYFVPSAGSTSSSIYVNGNNLLEDVSGTNILKVNNSYNDYDIGTVDISKKFDNYTDITNTSLALFLPYCGYQNLAIDEFIDGKISITARIDTLTGIIVYYVFSIRNSVKQLVSTFNGNMSMELPVNSQDFSRLFTGIYGMASSALAGNPSGVISNAQGLLQPNRAGNLAGNAGIMGVKNKVFLLIKRNTNYNPTNLAQIKGIGSNNYVRLGQVKGFTRCSDFHLDNIQATSTELDIISRYLTEGIIV